MSKSFKILLSILNFFFGLIVLIAGGWFLSQAWNMFVSPALGIIQIDYKIAIGLMLFVNFVHLPFKMDNVKFNETPPDDHLREQFLKHVSMLLGYAFLYGISLIINALIINP